MKFKEYINNIGVIDFSDDSIEESEIIDFSDVEEILNEAAFSEKNLVKAAELYGKILGRKMGGLFANLGTEQYQRKRGPGTGVRMMNEKGAQIRFNYDAKIAKKGNYELTSVDYWDPSNTNFTKPTRTVILPPELNVVQILDKIADALLTGSINEGKTAQEKQEWLVSKGLPKSASRSQKVMRQLADKAGLTDELEVFLGEVEKNTFEEELKKTEKKLTKEVYANPETVFDDIEDLLSVVAQGKWRTLIVCGMGGIGKTYHITEGPRSLKTLLGPQGGEWEYHSGTKAAPYSFYSTLFRERDKIIVFDEADSLLKNPDIIMMLKPILDTSGSNMAAYMSGTENMVGKSDQEIRAYAADVDARLDAGERLGAGKNDVHLPSKFHFEGGMIFISNMRADQIEGAILSRSIFIDVYLAQQDVMKRIKSIALAKYSAFGAAYVEQLMEGMGVASKEPEVEVQYMTPEFARKTKPFTVRSMDLAHILKQSGLSRWAELAQLYA